MKIDANAIKFRIALNFDTEETVYISDDVLFDIPSKCSQIYDPDYKVISDSYFSKEKIEQLKKEICEKIMSTENPFNIYEVDLDGYPVEENKIWK